MRFILSLLATNAAAVAMVGTNIGGWMVLEPWISPSLFYRFLDKTHSEGVAIDSWTFCQTLGPIEGNKVFRAHWDAWVTEDHLKELADRGVEIVRLPIGDWTLTQYGPYIGCMDGAAEKIEWFLDTAHKYNIKVLLDFHALKDSQNGYDNSGKASDVEWIDETHYKHWSTYNWHWVGEWNGQSYDSINWENIKWDVDQVRKVMSKWGKHPALYALEPINEPVYQTDLVALKEYYREVRQVIQEVNPEVVFVFYPSTDWKDWEDLFPLDDRKNVVMDTHFYTAWNGAEKTIDPYCNRYRDTFSSLKGIGYPIWVGEWSLATDTCAMWLAGFNEGGQSQFECERVKCPYSYLPEPLNTDFDRTAAVLGPWGEADYSMIRYGMCPTDSSFFSDRDLAYLGQCALDSFDQSVQAQFMWTFRNELEPKWSYIQAYDNGWIRKDKLFIQ